MATDPSLYNTSFSNAGLTRLKADVQQPTREGIREVAKQFESLFVQTMLKSMREAGSAMGSDLLNGEQTKQYRALFDQEIASRISQGQGMGLAGAVERQLLQNAGLADQGPKPGEGRELGDYQASAMPHRPIPEPREASGSESAAVPGMQAADRAAVLGRAAPVDGTVRRRSDGLATRQAQAANTPATLRGGKGPLWDSPEAFAKDVWPMAERVAEKLNVAPEAIVAQAALETGWGQHVIRSADGGSSHNLFNIKAHGGWRGEAVEVPTMEYGPGGARRENAAFRAYPSLEAAFDDYARFLQDNPRYRNALEAGRDGDAFVRELQEAGYATDPRYADKLQRIMRSEPVTTAESAFKSPLERTIT